MHISFDGPARSVCGRGGTPRLLTRRLLKFMVRLIAYLVAAVSIIHSTRSNGAESKKPTFSETTTDAHGAAEMKLTLEESALSEASILVQANHAGRTATRKFSFRKSAS